MLVSPNLWSKRGEFITKMKNRTDVRIMQALRIDCPKWFERGDFQQWLRDPQTASYGGSIGYITDAFTDFDMGEGHDMPSESYPGLPEDIWEEITQLCGERGIQHCVVWFANVDPE